MFNSKYLSSNQSYIFIKSINKYITTFFLLLLLSIVPSKISADTYLYSLGTTFSGTSPASLPPWLTATFADIGTNQVKLTLKSAGLSGQEFIGGWYFNFNPANDVTSLSFTRLTDSPPGTTTVSTGANAFGADGGGYYDLFFDFPESANGPRFGANETVEYNISSANTLNASMFNFASSPHGDNGTWYSAAHIQAIGAQGNDSGWIGSGPGTIIPVPEPQTYVLLGSMLLLLMALKKANVRKNFVE